MSGTSKLGWFVGVLAIAQLGLYIVCVVLRADSLFYFDPRIGIAVFLEGRHPTVLGIIRWFSVIWQFSVAAALIFGRVRPLVYLVGETALAVPSVLFIGLVIVANLSPSHGFSIPELIVPLLVFAVFTVWPVIVAIHLQRSGKE